MSIWHGQPGTPLSTSLFFGRFRKKSSKGSIPLYLVGALAFGLSAFGSAQSQTSYVDDTHAILNTDVPVKRIEGDIGYESYQFSGTNDDERVALDLRSAIFTVANSQNSFPTVDFDCNNGPLPVNRYPLKVYGADLTDVVGGLFLSEVPLESDWKPTYCNSAAIIFKEAPSSVVDGVRLTGAWDGIRPGGTTRYLTIKNSWISEVRDDAVENDDFNSLIFEDNLVDGAFQGISVHSGGDITEQSKETVYLTGNVIKIKEYLYKGEQRFGALFKNETTSPASIIRDTVVAVEYQGGKTFNGYWERSWSKIADCSNNLFLWLSDKPIPDTFPTPPACFTVLTGTEATEAWRTARENWINCHPRLERSDTDPTSDANQCTPDTYGGYSQQSEKRPLPPVID